MPTTRTHLYRTVWLTVACLLLAACGSPDTVTITDPNTTGSFTPGNIGEPVVRHGQDAMLRAIAFSRIEGDLAAARALVTAGRGTDAAIQLDATMHQSLLVLDGRAELEAPGLVERVVTSLERLRQSARAGAGTADFARAANAFEQGALEQLHRAVLPAPARRDPQFNAAVLASLLIDATVLYEQSLQGGTRIELPTDYRSAYGVLEVARTRQLEMLPAGQRERVRRMLGRIAAVTFPSPIPPLNPTPAVDVETRLGIVSDAIQELANIDTTPGPPGRQSPALLRQLASEIDAFAASSLSSADNSVIAHAYRQFLIPSSDALGGVDPTTLQQLEHGLGIELPAAIAAQDSQVAHSIASRLADTARQGASVIQQELDLLAASP